MTKAKGTMTVTLPDGRTMDVPRGLRGSALQRHVQGVLKEEIAAAEKAEAAASAALAEKERQVVEELSLKEQLAAAHRRASAMEQELADLKKASPEAGSLLLALSNANNQAMQTLQALNRWDSRKGAEVSLVAEELQKRNSSIDEETAARRRSAGELMNAIAIQQGITPPHPDLLEGVE